MVPVGQLNGDPATARRNIVLFECAGVPLTGRVGEDARAIPDTLAAQRIRVPCSGKLQPEHLLKAFEAGADLVLVLTCLSGECRYLEGRRRIERRVNYVRGLLDDIGLGGKRLLLLDGTEILQQTLAQAQAELTPSPLSRHTNAGG